MQLSPHQQQALLALARMSIVHHLNPHSADGYPSSSDPVLNIHAGCFVSLHDAQTHRLRGCVGRLITNDPLFKTVYETAASALGDPRFRTEPVTMRELPRLTLELSILSPLKLVANPLDFDPKLHGIYLTLQGRSGTFLPQVGQQTGWTREQLLTRLCTEKMGFPENAWKDPAATLQIYTALIIGPVPFETAQATRPGGFALNSNTFSV